MRIITGIAKGKNLKAPKSDTRPTADSVKEAIFSLICGGSPDMSGTRVLDLFAGSGALGIEALSRGAEYACFVDFSDDAVSVINDNLRGTKFDNIAVVKKAFCKRYLKSCEEKYDIVFLDPPYGKKLLQECLPYTGGVLNDGGIVVCEHERELTLPEYDNMQIKTMKSYGIKSVTVFNKPL